MAVIVGTLGSEQILDLLGASTIFGDSNAVVTVPTGNDIIFARDGDDVVIGDALAISGVSGGADKIYGGDGNDQIYGDCQQELRGTGGSDKIYLQEGNGYQVVWGDAGTVLKEGTGGNDHIDAGTSLSVSIYGDAPFLDRSKGGNDTVDAGEVGSGGAQVQLDGNLSFGSQGGSDRFLGSASRDVVYGEGEQADGTCGVDFLTGRGGSDYLYGDAYLINNGKGGADTLNGGSGNDSLYGDSERLGSLASAGNDTLFGNGGQDVIYGDSVTREVGSIAGNDRIDGGAGNDKLYGDSTDSTNGGRDVFVFAGSFGNDTVFDFRSGEDVMELQGYVSTGDFTRTIDTTGSTLTFWSGASIRLEGYTGNLSPSDFVFV